MLVVLNNIQIDSLSDHILNNIIDDIEDRQGLGDEWDTIDSGVIEEIKNSWKNIIRNQIENFE